MDSDDKAMVLRYINEVADRAEGRRPTPMFDAASGPPVDSDGHQPAAAHHLGVACEHAHMGTRQPSSARLRRLKLLMAGALRPITSYQTTFNVELAEALAELLRHVGEMEARANAGASQLDAAVATAETAEDLLVTTTVRCQQLSESVRDLDRRLADQQAEIAFLRDKLATEGRVLRSRQNVVLRAAREALGDGGPQPLNALSRELSREYDELYRDLEDTFRGTRDHVKRLVEVYLPDVADLGGGPVLDVGCGRGEWLELLGEQGIAAYGIDVNAEFAEALSGKGLDVRQGDALEHLQELPEGSLRAVTGHHLAEHLSLDTLVALVDASLHALQPGGVLILETPNPTNLRVGASSFYLDPTHLKPLHPEFLEFLALSRGFIDVEVRYLHPAAGAVDVFEPLGGGPGAEHLAEDLRWALYGPQDYGLVARKLDRD